MLHEILYLQGTRMLVLEFRQACRECAEGGELEHSLERGEQVSSPFLCEYEIQLLITFSLGWFR